MPPEALRVLFVDDEPEILAGLRAGLRRERKRWNMRFATGGAEALAMLAEQSADVVVSDMRMPEMDGATFLRHVQDDFPQTFRIILSGHVDEETAVRAASAAHQWLDKPINREALTHAVDGASTAVGLLGSDAVLSIVGGVGTLPSAPRIHQRLVGLLSDAEVGVDSVASLVEQDPAVAAKLLQMCNSAFFALARRVSSVQQAVSILGFRTVSQLVLYAEILSALPSNVPGFSIEDSQRRALIVSKVAQSLLSGEEERQAAASAGLLSDLGSLVLANQAPHELARVLAEDAGTESARIQREREILGVTQAEVGAATLALWGFPSGIVEAVAFQHQPDHAVGEDLDVAAAVYIGTSLVDALLAERRGQPGEPLPAAAVERLGAQTELPSWSANAERIALAILDPES